MLTDAEITEISRRAILDRDQYSMCRLVAVLRSREPLLLDIGAHVGWWTVKFLEHCPRGRSECYEPIAENVVRIPRDPRVTVHQVAVDVREGALRLYRHTGTEHLGPVNNALWSALAAFGGPHTAERVVPSVDFRDVLLAHEHVDVVKMDVEGHEGELLRRVTPRELSRIDVFVLEDHAGSRVRVDRRIFAEAGMRLWYNAKGGPGHPVFASERLGLGAQEFPPA